MNILVSGADGFIGSNVVSRLIKEGHNVLAVDIIKNPNRLNIQNKKIVYIHSKVDELSKFEKDIIKFNPEIVYHFAWEGSSGFLREDYYCQIKNALDTVRFLEFSAKIGVKKFIVAGSIAEFETSNAIYSDNFIPNKSYYYGMGKQIAHELCKPLANELNIDLIWGYITNAYGVGEVSPRLINSVIKKIIDNEDFRFTSGVQNYDFLYIDDVVEAFYLLGKKGIKNKSYIIGSGNAKPLKKFILQIYKILNAKCKPIFGNLSYTGINLPLNNFSIKNLQNDTLFKPKITFSEGIVKTYNWLKFK